MGFIKTFNTLKKSKIMAVRLVFESTARDDVQTVMECFANDFEEIFISIDSGGYPPSHICLDKSTAIKLSKTLRAEISKLNDNG